MARLLNVLKLLLMMRSVVLNAEVVVMTFPKVERLDTVAKPAVKVEMVEREFVTKLLTVKG
jgi:hypothetical protein